MTVTETCQSLILELSTKQNDGELLLVKKKNVYEYLSLLCVSASIYFNDFRHSESNAAEQWEKEVNGDMDTKWVKREDYMVKVFKNGPRNICGRQPLKKLK